MNKYEFTGETKIVGDVTLNRIRALINIKQFSVKVGDLGGWIEKEKNLSQRGSAWVSGDAQVSGNAWVFGNAQVSDDAQVFGNARVSGGVEQ
jgi:YdcK-like protein with beta solenoid repeat